MPRPRESPTVPSPRPTARRSAGRGARRVAARAMAALPLAALALVAAGCAARGAPAPTAGGAPADRAAPGAGATTPVTTSATSTVAPGVSYRRLHLPEGPWMVHVLEVALDSCWTFAARKAGGQAVGRLGTRALAAELAAAGERVVGAVNADFFTFRPPGSTENVHVERGDLLLGPSDRPAFALTGDGRARIGALAVAGHAAVGADTLPLGAWNRGPSRGPAAAFAEGADRSVALFDARYGARTDSAPGRLFVRLAPVPRADARPLVGVVVDVDSGAAATLPPGGYVLAAGASAPVATRARLRALRPGRDTVRLEVALLPMPVREAVGGWPVLVQGGQIVPALDTVGPAGFRARNPRTAVALAGARRALLVALDGRQPGHSVGATLPELAAILQRLGATEALNLDGGGSTTLVVGDASGGAGALRVVNRPSDPTGERPVGNALAVVRGGCR